ncbi:MAG: CotH kinase family protein [Polyangiaceae bacterium]|nr:CotH kinase family protein [Polyangiaceae bacterium]
MMTRGATYSSSSFGVRSVLHASFALGSLALLPTLSACDGDAQLFTGGSGGAATTNPTTSAGGTGGSAGSTGGTSPAGGGGMGGMAGAPPTWPQACSDLYDQDLLPTFELTFSPTDLSGLQGDCQSGSQNYRPATLTYGSETVDVMVRLKGNWSWDCGKMQFVVSFNEIDPNARFHGLRKMVFDAPWYDRTFLHERVAFPFFKKRGLPYSCVNNAKIMLNGQYLGVYANLERLDKEYLQRNFEEADGNLYQGGVELKTNEDIGDTSDLAALQAAGTVAELEQLIDMNQAMSEWASEAMLPAMDNYWAGVEINYYLYHHPSRGFLYLPYDMDIAFGDPAYPDGSLIWPDALYSDPILYEHPGWKKEDLMKKVLSDPKWCDAFVAELTLAREAYSPSEMSAQIDTWSSQIAAAVSQDTHKQFSTQAHQQAVNDLKAFFSARAAVVDQWLAQGNHCPASF